MDMQVNSQLIRNERLKRAWSQEHLAQVSGLGIRTVQRIEVMRISITPTIMEDGTVFLDMELYLFVDGEFKLHMAPKLLTTNGQKGVMRVGRSANGIRPRMSVAEDSAADFEGLELEITPMIE